MCITSVDSCISTVQTQNIAKSDERSLDCVQKAREQPDEVVTLYLDEFSFYRWPTMATMYADAGRYQPQAKQTPGYQHPWTSGGSATM